MQAQEEIVRVVEGRLFYNLNNGAFRHYSKAHIIKLTG